MKSIPKISKDGEKWIHGKIKNKRYIIIPPEITQQLVGKSKYEYVFVVRLARRLTTPEGKEVVLRLLLILSDMAFSKLKALSEDETTDEMQRGALVRTAIRAASRTRLHGNGKIRIGKLHKLWAGLSKDVMLITCDKLVRIAAWPLKPLTFDKKKEEISST